jgi:hypothetical protein
MSWCNEHNAYNAWATTPTMPTMHELQCLQCLQWQVHCPTMATILTPYNTMATIRWLQYNGPNTMATIRWLQYDGYNAYNELAQWATMRIPRCNSWARARNERMFFYSQLVNHPRTCGHRPGIGVGWGRRKVASTHLRLQPWENGSHIGKRKRKDNTSPTILRWLAWVAVAVRSLVVNCMRIECPGRTPRVAIHQKVDEHRVISGHWFFEAISLFPFTHILWNKYGLSCVYEVIAIRVTCQLELHFDSHTWKAWFDIQKQKTATDNSSSKWRRQTWYLWKESQCLCPNQAGRSEACWTPPSLTKDLVSRFITPQPDRTLPCFACQYWPVPAFQSFRSE